MFKKLMTISFTAIIGLTTISVPADAAAAYVHHTFGPNFVGYTNEVQGMHRNGTLTMVARGGVEGRVIENCKGLINPTYHSAHAEGYTKDKVYMKGGCTYKVAFDMDANESVDVYLSNDFILN